MEGLGFWEYLITGQPLSYLASASKLKACPSKYIVERPWFSITLVRKIKTIISKTLLQPAAQFEDTMRTIFSDNLQVSLSTEPAEDVVEIVSLLVKRAHMYMCARVFPTTPMLFTAICSLSSHFQLLQRMTTHFIQYYYPRYGSAKWIAAQKQASGIPMNAEVDHSDPHCLLLDDQSTLQCIIVGLPVCAVQPLIRFFTEFTYLQPSDSMIRKITPDDLVQGLDLTKHLQALFNRIYSQLISGIFILDLETLGEVLVALDAVNSYEHDILSPITALSVLLKYLPDARPLFFLFYLLRLTHPILDSRHFALVDAVYRPADLAQKLSTSDEDCIYHSIMSKVTEAIAPARLISNSTGTYSDKVEEVLDNLRDQLREPILRCQRYLHEQEDSRDLFIFKNIPESVMYTAEKQIQEYIIRYDHRIIQFPLFGRLNLLGWVSTQVN